MADAYDHNGNFNFLKEVMILMLMEEFHTTQFLTSRTRLLMGIGKSLGSSSFFSSSLLFFSLSQSLALFSWIFHFCSAWTDPKRTPAIPVFRYTHSCVSAFP